MKSSIVDIKKVRGTTPSPKSNQNNPNYVRIILMLQRYNFFCYFATIISIQLPKWGLSWWQKQQKHRP